MAGVNAHPEFTGSRSSPGELWKDFLRVPLRVRPGVRLGVELDPLSTDIRDPRDLNRVGIHEKADSNPETAQFLHNGTQPAPIVRKIPTVVRRALIWIIGHKRALRRFHPSNDRHELGERVAFDIELDAGKT